MIAIIDFGMGNLKSVHRAFEKLSVPAVITSDPEEINRASQVVLPGVGSFPDCMKNLRKRKLIDPILGAIESKKPFLGICLGFQVLFDESEEFGKTPGLGVLRGRVVRFRLTKKYKIPHMGWNRIQKQKRIPLLSEIPDGAYVYFVHSYHVVPEDGDLIVTTTDYGKDFCSSVIRGNLFACQFHPEKSQKVGLDILTAFAALTPHEPS